MSNLQKRKGSFFVLAWLMLTPVLSCAQMDSAYLSQWLPFLHQPALVQQFYQSRNFAPVWNQWEDVNGLTRLIGESDAHGLNPAAYHDDDLRCLHDIPFVRTDNSPQREILLTDAFFHYARHQMRGRVDPKNLYPGIWKQHLRDRDVVADLSEAVRNGTVREVLQRYRPAYPEYDELVRQLAWYRALPTIEVSFDTDETLIIGDSSEMVSRVRRKLAWLGYRGAIVYDSLTYDSAMEITVKSFQQRNHLEADGIIGGKTMQILRMDRQDFIDKILINLERYRWMPAPEPRSIRVNIPEFSLRLFDHDTLCLEMRVIVGRPSRPTPVLSSAVRYLIINPTWTVPRTILREDVLPAVKQDISYLKNHRLHVIDATGAEVDPGRVDWIRYSDNNFPYQLRQESGPGNALGVLKFHFANEFNVFLHDTNAPFLFRNHDRALSSGCVRVAHPLALASWLLQPMRGARDRVLKRISSGATETLVMAKPVPVHLVYFTAGTDADGNLMLWEDVYGLDEILQKSIAH